MTREEIVDILQANVDKRVRITFDDGVVQSVSVLSVDGEGFVHSGPNGEDTGMYWTRFENVESLEPDISN